MGKVKRSYESPGRRRQAEITRRRLVASARELFVRQGYAATTIDSIASDADVAVQTFYATFGSKRAVLLAILDEIEREADLPGLRAAIQEATADPHGQLRHIVDFNARLFPRTADVLEVVRSAGRADADLVSLWREGEGRRRAAQAPIVRGWARSGALRPALRGKDAADILWALTGPDTYRLFVTESGWSVSRYRKWLFSTLEQLLLNDLRQS